MDLQISSSDKTTNARLGVAKARSFLTRVASIFAEKSFKPHSLFTGGHAQTLAAYAWPRRYRFDSPRDEERLFEIEKDVKVLAHCRWQQDPVKHSTIVLWHGIEGSTASIYMIAMAHKAFRAGFNVVRVNFRNCGGTEHLSSTLYHGGMSSDLRAVINELIERDGLKRLFPIGFSLGGNLVLKLAGEYHEDPPREVVAVCVVSPSVDLRASTDMILLRKNWIYHQDFMRRLKKRIRTKQKLYPQLYDLSKLTLVHTIRDFDEHYTSIAHGFSNAEDYYYRSSSLRVVEKIRIPTLILHAHDDPFIPFTPLREPGLAANPFILLLETKRGGHVAFISAKKVGEDRFWAENRAIEFCLLAETELRSQDPTSESVSTAEGRDCGQ
jgi:predicted alpha/beta-fold hydrolase